MPETGRDLPKVTQQVGTDGPGARPPTPSLTCCLPWGGGPEVRPARAAPLLHVLLGIVPGVPTTLIKEDLRGWVFLATLCETAHLSLDILKDKSRLFLGNRPDARPFIIWWHGSQRITDKGKQARRY